nr:hypothetical protein [uncultured Chryseobacterium sp.]
MRIINNFLLLIVLININIFGQVGINTDKPAQYSGLHISERIDPSSANPDKYSGVLIQRYTEAQRDGQLTPNMNNAQNSMLIYNTTEDCYNYWNNIEQEWKSLCGQLGKSQFTFDCAGIELRGTYVEGRELTASNYLSIPVTVTKAGEYTFLATTTNGYSFFVTGTFLNTGSYTIQAVAQGTPSVVQTDNLEINANGLDVICTPTKTVTVLSAAGTYTMSCSRATVNGVYKVGTALTANNTITLPMNVTTLGSYTITTNTVDGISFSASGTFTAAGVQNITLHGTGTPSSTSTKVLTITSDSQGAVSTTCNVNIIVAVPVKKIVHVSYNSDYGFAAGQKAAYNLLNSPQNFGTLATSLVKTEGFTHVNVTSAGGLLTQLNAVEKPDIVIIAVHYIINAAERTALVNYLNQGGVLILMTDNANGSGEVTPHVNVLRDVFASPAITYSTIYSAGAVYPMINQNDKILNGPFGDIRGKHWGEDSSSTIMLQNVPSSAITAYSGGSAINSTTTNNGVTMFKHNSLNLFWIGDGGFLANFYANGEYPGFTVQPFVTDSNNFPLLKNYGFAGNGYSAGSLQVYNSVLFANVMAWAIEQAEFQGINTQ